MLTAIFQYSGDNFIICVPIFCVWERIVKFEPPPLKGGVSVNIIKFMKTYPPLPKSFKNRYSFKLGTTSFIYPDLYIPNVKMLGPYLDEIELLMFESTWPDSLPAESDIEALRRLGEDLKLTYNIHLPTDVSLADEDAAARNRAAETLNKFILRTAPLNPSAYALHIPFTPIPDINIWQDRVAGSLNKLLPSIDNTRRVAVETLDYPFEKIKPFIKQFDLSVCMDIGHLIIHKVDINLFFEEYADRIPLIHLHGVRNGKDHIALDSLSSEHIVSIVNILKDFKGVVSLEVFSYKHLMPSLAFLETII